MSTRLIAALALFGILGTAVLTAGCNTVAGAGKDIQRGGEAVHDEAKDVQKKM